MPIDASRLAGVYLLTPDADERGFGRVLEVTRQALDAGVRVVQYRNKTRARAPRTGTGAARLAGCALAIVNDDLELACHRCGRAASRTRRQPQAPVPS
jgi:thiamine monophosphate synthase